MKGLLYKNLINGKLNILVIIFYLSYIVMMIEVLAYEFDKEVTYEGKFESLSETIIMMLSCVFIACVIPAAMSTELCTRDNKTKWTNYAIALPSGYKAVVLEKYIVVLIGHIVGVLASLFTIYSVENRFEVDTAEYYIEVNTDIFFMLMLILIGVSLIGNAFLLPFIIRNKSGWMNIFFTCCYVVICYVGFAYVSLGDISFFQQDNLMERIFMWVATHEKEIWRFCYGLVGVGVVAQVVSYAVTVKTYLKYV